MDIADATGVVTTTFLRPAVPAGVVTVIDVELLIVRPVPNTPSKVTAVAPVKLVPVIVTTVPPAVVPDEGEIAAIVEALVKFKTFP